MSHTIKPGDYVIVQRQRYTKLYKVKPKGNLTLGYFIIEIDKVIGEPYETIFQMKPKQDSKKLYTLEKVEQLNTISQLNIESSGKDNRNITDDGTSQSLTKEEIIKLKDESLSSADIVGKLINNSKTFSSKTEYSQEKYMKKKEKKYFEYVQFRKPTLRLLVQMYYRQEPAKILGLRIDDVSQILTYGNIQAGGNFLLYDSGTSGLMTASILNSIGANTEGCLIHMHPGNECQKNAVLALQFPQEQLDRCINVNLYSVLRCFYQNEDSYCENEVQAKLLDCDEKTETTENEIEKAGAKHKLSGDNNEAPPPKKACWQYDNEKACKILTNKVDGLIITCKEHPLNIFKELVTFLKGSRTFVVFHLMREPLEELYVHLKTTLEFISLRLSNNFMRNYQVLPDRTHPEVNMSSGGYILTGFKLC